MTVTRSTVAASRTAGFVPSAFVGGVFADDTVGACLAMAAICLAGVLGAGPAYGATAFILASFLGPLALRVFGRVPAPFANAQDTRIAILASAVAIAAAGTVDDDTARLVTALAVLGTCAVATGTALLLVGRSGLGRLVRVFPCPVACGSLASSDLLPVLAGVGVITEASGTGPADLTDLIRNLCIAAALAGAFA